MKVVFIASLSHSGSTLLDLLLGIHPRLIGLGEVSKVINFSEEDLEDAMKMRCTCGRQVADCEFWSPIFSHLLVHNDLSPEEKYRFILDSFRENFGEKQIPVDSSKYARPMSRLADMRGIELSVIHLLKDVRSFAVSHRESLSAEIKYGHLPKLFGSYSLSRWVYSASIKSPSYLFWKWYLRNLSLQRVIRSSKLLNAKISYEELSLATEVALGRLFDFLSLEPPPASSFVPADTRSHVFLGNPMINDEKKMKGIQYDERWFSRRDWILPSRIFPQIMAYNKEHVYKHLPGRANV